MQGLRGQSLVLSCCLLISQKPQATNFTVFLNNIQFKPTGHPVRSKVAGGAIPVLGLLRRVEGEAVCVQ